MPKKNIVYIAGPMRGKPHFNYPAFMRAEKQLRALGYEVINPATMGDAYGTPEQLNADPKLLRKLMDAELREIAKCNAIYLLRGWEKSVGARAELAMALAFDTAIMQQRATK